MLFYYNPSYGKLASISSLFLDEEVYLMKIYGKKRRSGFRGQVGGRVSSDAVPSWYALLSQALMAEYGLTMLPEVARTDAGKPYFPTLPQLHFNISHTKNLILCALSDRPVGVDIETVRPRRASLPRFALSPEEYRHYEALGGDWSAFYTLWTQKEAWCKYTGLGLQALWGQTPPPHLCYGTYTDHDWCAAVCGEEPAPTSILWLKGDTS